MQYFDGRNQRATALQFPLLWSSSQAVSKQTIETKVKVTQKWASDTTNLSHKYLKKHFDAIHLNQRWDIYCTLTAKINHCKGKRKRLGTVSFRKPATKSPFRRGYRAEEPER